MLSNLFSYTIGWRDKLLDSRASKGFVIENFDGLRAVAALMVLNQHTGTFPTLILGPTGVWLFFTLSGYLLYSAMLRTGEVVPSSRSLVAYLIRRIFRIMPLYIVVLFVMSIYFKWPVGEVSTYWINEHLLLLNAEDHLWPVTLILLFSVFLPFIVIMLAPVVSSNLRSILLLTMAIFAWWVFEYRGLLITRISTPYFTPFLLGMVLVHLQPRITPGIGLLMVVSGLLGILGFGVNAGWADAFRQWWSFNDLAGMWGYGWPVYGACALLVLGVGAARSRFWGNPWLRLCGILSYGIYLWHWLIILWLGNLDITGPAFHLLALFGSLAAALFTYIVIEQPFEILGRRLARKTTAGDKFRGVSMVTISVCLIGIYLGLRHIYPIDSNIQIHVEILPSQNTLTQVFITDKRDFFEEDSAYHHTLGGAWQEIELTIPELRVGKIRLDPGDGPGTFRIRSFRIKYPFDAQWYPLPLEEFRPDQGVESALLVDDELVIETQPLHTDPILVYRGDTHQPAIRPWSSFLLWSALATALLLIFCVLLDRVALRAPGRLKDDSTLDD